MEYINDVECVLFFCKFIQNDIKQLVFSCPYMALNLKFNRIDENRLYNGRNVYHIVINVSDNNISPRLINYDVNKKYEISFSNAFRLSPKW